MIGIQDQSFIEEDSLQQMGDGRCWWR
jgi:hypothetical protein